MPIDRAKTVEALKDSLAHFRHAIQAPGDAGANRPQNGFGRQATLWGSFILITAHFGKHSGAVSLAYRRINGVVPPRNAEQQQQQKRAEKAKSWWFGAKFQALG
jgi:hypothetical protein